MGDGVTGKGAAFEFLAFFTPIPPRLGLETCSNLIKYPFLCKTKMLFGAKVLVKIP